MNGSGNVHANQSCVSRSTSLPTARHDVSPGDSMPDACTISRVVAIARIMKSANDSLGGLQLRTDAAAAEAQIVDRDAAQQPRAPARRTPRPADGRSS